MKPVGVFDLWSSAIQIVPTGFLSSVVIVNKSCLGVASP